MRVPAIVAVAWLGSVGCDRVLGLEERMPTPDAPPPCADITPFGSTCRTIALVLKADTALNSAMSDTAAGTADAMRITGLDPGLFKFDLAAIDPPIDLDERIAGARLTLPVVASNGSARACSQTIPPNCGQCGASSIESTQIYWVTSAWSQLYATYNHADQGVPWVEAGAGGPQRSDLVATGGPPAQSVAEIVVTPDDLMRVKAECFATTELSVLVLVQGAAWIRQLGTQPCTMDRSATLELTVCK